MGEQNIFSKEKTKSLGQTTLKLLEGDIAAYDGEAVVNAANDHLWMGSGVAGALKRGGGASIEKEAMACGPLPLGEACLTGGGTLKAPHVIHAVVMGQDLRTSEAILSRAVKSALLLARERGIRRLALPALGTGVGAFPLADCARLMTDEIREEVRENPTSFDEIALVLYGVQAYSVFEEALEF